MMALPGKCDLRTMKQSWRKYLSARAPRYTSYPSALYFSDKVDGDTYAQALSRVGLYEPISIYVHVPFCRQLCWYCGCNMRVENNYQRALTYVEHLCDEIRLVAGKLQGRGRPVSIHFGGGSPNFLAPSELGRILEAIENNLSLTDDTRLAIELDPRLIKQGSIAELAALGFSRISFGVQDFDFEVQKAINRIQSYEHLEACVSAVREAGIEDLSFDLLYGLPRQTLASFAETIAKTIALAPDRVSVFGYAHLPSALPRQRMIDNAELPDETLRADLAELADAMLVAAGYGQIGFDHYAKPGNSLYEAACAGSLRRNFQGFTDDIATTMIGLGASAVSFVGGVYAQNAKAVKQYSECLAAGRLATEKGVARTARDDSYAQLIEDLLCRQKADLSAYAGALGPNDIVHIKQSLGQFIQDKAVSVKGDLVKISPDAKDLSRAIVASFDPYASKTPAFSKVV